jgi:flagellar biosynthetic protein FlhB
MAEETKPLEDRTEAATPQRLKRGRDEGHAPVSRDVATFASLAGVMLAIWMLSGGRVTDATMRLSVFLARTDSVELLGREAWHLAYAASVPLIAPAMLAASICGAGSMLLQTGFLVSPSAIRPKLSRIDPRAGFGRLIGADNLLETLKSLVKLTVVGFALWHVMAGDMASLGTLLWRDPRLLAQHTMPNLVHIALIALAVQGVVAAQDLFWVRLRHARQMRMSRQEVRDEMRESDGDPAIKARIRRIRQQRAGKRMMAAVPKATVVIVNPTHYAVALAYDRANSAAPRVVAKGADLIAARIREVAETNKVPLVTNAPLARALYRVEVDSEIPADMYQAVAEVIAYVMRLNGSARRVG